MSSNAEAQVLVWDAVSPTPDYPAGYIANVGFGQIAFSVKDLNGDGIDDLLLSNSNASPNNVLLAGWTGVLCGATGTVLRSWIGTTYLEAVHACGSPGDVNGDGSGDVAVVKKDAAGAQFLGYYSGADGSLLNAFYSGGPPCALLRLGFDRDSDGMEECLLDLNNYMQILEGVNSVPQLTIFEPNISINMGFDPEVIPDFDGDGHPDILVGCPGVACSPPSSFATPIVGRVRIYSGWTGAQLAEYLGDAACDRFGLGVGALGDIDGDDVQDFVATQPGLNQMKTISGATGAVIHVSPLTAACPANCQYSYLTGVGDVDGDGSGDFVVTHLPYSAVSPWAEVRRGFDHSLLMAIPQIQFGPVVLSTGVSYLKCGDEDGDGFVELLVGYYGYYGYSGHLRRYSLRPPGVSSFGLGCGAGGLPPPRIAATGSLSLGDVFTTTMSGAAPGTFAALVVGVSNTTASGDQLPLNLSPIGLPGCNLLVSPDIVLFPPATPQMNFLTRSEASMVVPSLPALVGLTIYAQWAAGDPTNGSVAVTRGLAATIQP